MALFYFPWKHRAASAVLSVGNATIDGPTLHKILIELGLLHINDFSRYVKLASKKLGETCSEGSAIGLASNRTAFVQAALAYILYQSYQSWAAKKEPAKVFTGNSFGNFLMALIAAGCTEEDVVVAAYARGYYQDVSCRACGIDPEDYSHLLVIPVGEDERPLDILNSCNAHYPHVDLPVFELAITHVGKCALSSRIPLDGELWITDEHNRKMTVYPLPPFHHPLYMRVAAEKTEAFLFAQDGLALPRQATLSAPVWVTKDGNVLIISTNAKLAISEVCQEISRTVSWDAVAAHLPSRVVSLGLPSLQKAGRLEDPLRALTGGIREKFFDWSTVGNPLPSSAIA